MWPFPADGVRPVAAWAVCGWLLWATSFHMDRQSAWQSADVVAVVETAEECRLRRQDLLDAHRRAMPGAEVTWAAGVASLFWRDPARGEVFWVDYLCMEEGAPGGAPPPR